MSLSIWTVYDHPSDFPDVFVARESEITKDGAVHTAQVMTSADLDGIREVLASWGLTCLPRDDNDDPVIVECWL